MIVNIRLEVTDEQRSALSLRLHPSAAKRLATRKEFVEHVEGLIDQLVEKSAPQTSQDVVAPFDDHLADDPDALREYVQDHEGELTMQKAHSRLTGAPEHPIKAALFHINNALFGLTNAMRAAANANASMDALDATEDCLMTARETLVKQHDKEIAA